MAEALALVLVGQPHLQRGVEELEQRHHWPEQREESVAHSQIKYGAYSLWHLDC